MKIHCTNHLELFCAKNRSKKQEIFQKLEHFENRLSCKGYNTCKIVILAQKLKFIKTSQNPLYKSFRVVLWKNRFKKHEIFQKWERFENRPSCKGYSPWKSLTLAQKLKLQETCQNPLYKSFRVVLCKKRLQKSRNIPEMRAFWKSAIMQKV